MHEAITGFPICLQALQGIDSLQHNHFALTAESNSEDRRRLEFQDVQMFFL